VKVVFYKDNHHQHHDSLITCHLSLYVPNFGSIEIYAHQQDEKQAFHKAKKKLKRLVAKSQEFTHHSISMEQLENIA
jgi:predicted SpoU family rRNA methylase